MKWILGNSVDIYVHQGPFIGIAGSAFTNMVHFDVLSPVIPLAWNQHELELKELAAKIFGAFRIAVQALRTYYELPPPPTTDLRFPYPQAFTCRREGIPRSFRYVLQIFQERLIFYAQLDPRPAENPDQMQVDSEPSQPVRVIIKFVRRYSVEAHDYCARQGYSPQLMGYETVAGGWYLVVMEEVDMAIYQPFVDSPDKPTFPDREKLRPAVVGLIEGLHDEGYVHGDLRGANLLVATDGRQESLFKLIDFDWAGEAGVVKYPANMNPKVWWPEGAVDGQPIQKAHDLEMLNSSLPEPRL
jgi:hypothetical protein